MKRSELLKKHDLEKAKLTARRKGKMRETAQCCSELADLYLRHDRFEEASVEIRQEIEALQHLNDAEASALAHRRLGECLMHAGQFEEASNNVLIYKEASKNLGDLSGEQLAEHVLGTVYLSWAHVLDPKDTKEKQKCLSRALAAFRKSLTMCNNAVFPDKSHRQIGLKLNIGIAINLIGQHQTAIDMLEEVLRSIGKEDPLFNTCLMHLTLAYYNRGDMKAAKKVAERRIELAKHIQDNAASLEAAVALTHICLEMDNNQEALEALQQAIAATHNRGDRHSAEKLLSLVEKVNNAMLNLKRCKSPMSLYKMNEQLGDLFSDHLSIGEMKHYAKAVQFYEEMKKEAIKAGVSVYDCYMSLAATYRDMGAHAKAIQYLQLQAEYEGENAKERCNTYLTLAYTCEEQADSSSPQATNKWYAAAAEDAEKTNDLRLVAKVYHSWFQSINSNGGQSDQCEAVSKRWSEVEKFFSESATESDNADSCPSTPLDESSDDEMLSPSEMRKKSSFRKMSFRRNAMGETPLHVACKSNRIKVVERLLNQGCPVDDADNAGWTALHEAANRGYENIIRLLIESNANVNKAGCQGVTALMDAAANGHLQTISLLLDAGADVNCLDDDARSVLDYLEDYKRQLEDNPELQHRVENVEAIVKERMDPSLPVAQGRKKRRRVMERSDVTPIRNRLEEDVAELTPRQPGFGRQVYIEAMKSLSSRSSIAVAAPAPRPPTVKGLLPEDEICPDEQFYVVDVPATSHSRSGTVAIENLFKPADHGQVQRKRPSQQRLEHKRSVVTPTPVSGDDHALLSSCSDMDNDDDQPLILSRKSSHRSQFENPLSVESSWSSVPKSTNIIKVVIHDWTAAVPVPQSHRCKTLKWLADEASARYSERHSRKPCLIFCTQDGAELSYRDQVGDVIDQQQMLFTKILSWHDMGIADQFLQLCLADQQRSFNTWTCNVLLLLKRFRILLAPYSDVTNAFRQADQTLEFNLEHCYVPPKMINWSFQAFQGSRLTQIRLVGCSIPSSAMSTLATGLSSLITLCQLTISSCQLTSDHVKVLHKVLSSCPERAKLPALKGLDLSLNPLGNACNVALLSLLHLCPRLSELSLKGVEMTEKFFSTPPGLIKDLLRGIKVQSINLAMNSLSAKAVEIFLNNVDQSILTHIDLSHCLSANEPNWPLMHKVLISVEQLTSLCLSNVHLQRHWSAFESTAPRLTSIRELHLAANALGPEMVEAILLMAAEQWPLLVHLNLSANKLVNVERPFFLSALGKCLEKTTPLRHLQLSVADKQCQMAVDIWTGRWRSTAKVSRLLCDLTLSVANL